MISSSTIARLALVVAALLGCGTGSAPTAGSSPALHEPPPVQPPPSAPPPVASTPEAPPATPDAGAGDAAAPCDPLGLRTVDATEFSFSLPCGTKDVPVRGIDSRVGHYEGDGLSVRFDYGWYSNDLSDQRGSLDYREEQVVIDGRAAKLVTYTNPGQPARAVVTAVHFASVGPPGAKAPPGGMRTRLTLWVEDRSSADPTRGKTIVRSIRFARH